MDFIEEKNGTKMTKHLLIVLNHKKKQHRVISLIYN